MMMVSKVCYLTALLFADTAAFTVSSDSFHQSSTKTRFSSSQSSSLLFATKEPELSDTESDILKPKYEIEKTALRIGHGFDIHRMVPVEEAGQPVVIGGVTIDHKDQKVSKKCVRILGCGV